MWFTFKLTFATLMIWHFIKWRVSVRRYKRRVISTPLTPGEAVERMTPKANKPGNDNQLIKYVPIETPAPQQIANDTTPPAPQRARRDDKVIDDVISALRNLGMTKAKAKRHANLCYDKLNQPSLNELLTYSIKSLSS